jgi:cohesin complex subunit SCC1
MRLLEIRADPVAHFMPTKPGPGGSLLFNAGPPGLAPELAQMFMRPITNLTLSKRRGEDANDRPKKKARIDGSVNGDASEVEVARRAASVARSIGLGSDVVPGLAGDIDFGGIEGGTGMDDFQMDVDLHPDVSGEIANLQDTTSKGGDETRVSTPAADLAEDLETYADADCPIASFDVRPAQSQSISQGQPQEGQNDGDELDQTKGYSRNTVNALSIIRKELDSTMSPHEGEKVLSFANLSVKVDMRLHQLNILLNSFLRHHAAPLPRSFSNYSYSEPVIALSSPKVARLRILKSEPKTNYGSTRSDKDDKHLPRRL